MNARSRSSRALFGPAWLALVCGCQHPAGSLSAQATPAAPPLRAAAAIDPRGPLTLESRARTGEAYTFKVGPCTGAAPAQQCELAAEIVRGGKVVFSLPLPPCWSDQVSRVDPAAFAGIEAPLTQPAAWLAFSIGQGEVAQSLAARVVRLAPQREGILLRTVYGGAARDVLLLRQEDQLRALEIEGRWTGIAVNGRDPASDEILLSTQVSGEAGFLWARALSWDSKGETLAFSANADPPAFLISAARYPSFAEAEAAKSKSCLPGAVVAPTDPYQGFEPGGYLIGTLSGDSQQASAAAAAAQRCSGHAAKLLPLRYRWAARARLPLGALNQTAEVGVGRYNGSGWPLLVSLGMNQPPPQQLEVSWPLSSPVGHAALDVDLPAGDPLKPLRGAGGWSFGTDEATSLIALSTVRLTADQRALLVSQEAGFEHRSRRHDLVIGGSAGPRLGWSAVDAPGPAWSNVVIRAKDSNTDELLLLSTFESSQEGQADRLSASRLLWDAKRGEMLSTPVTCADGIYLAITRTFPSLQRAIAGKEEPCPSAPAGAATANSLVLAAPPRSGLGGYVLAQVSTEAELARQAVSDAARCWPGTRAKLVSWCPGPKR